MVYIFKVFVKIFFTVWYHLRSINSTQSDPLGKKEILVVYFTTVEMKSRV